MASVPLSIPPCGYLTTRPLGTSVQQLGVASLLRLDRCLPRYAVRHRGHRGHRCLTVDVVIVAPLQHTVAAGFTLMATVLRYYLQ